MHGLYSVRCFAKYIFVAKRVGVQEDAVCSLFEGIKSHSAETAEKYEKHQS
jgi:hypothetical protein